MSTTARLAAIVAVWVGGLLAAGAAQAAMVTVSTAAALDSAWRGAHAGDTIVITPGTYNLVAGIQMNVQNLTIRGSTGNRDDVILRGSGMNTSGVDEGVCFNTNGGVLKDLTLKDFFYHGCHIRAENQASNILIQNVKTWNIGERHIKCSRDGSHLNYLSNNVLIQGVYMLQDTVRNHPSNPDYLGGIDAMGISNWTIRDCVAKGIYSENSNSNAAIFIWSGASNVTIERNRIYDCQKDIALGNPYYGGGQNGWPNSDNWQVSGAIVRDNMCVRTGYTDGNNIGLELVNTKDVKIDDNTFYSDNAGYFREIDVRDGQAQYAGATTNLAFLNNIIRGGCNDASSGNWSAAAIAALGNIVDNTGATVLSGWFAGVGAGDLHLMELASAAIGHATTLADVPTDYDGEVRPYGSHADMGADEWRLAGDLDLDLNVDFSDYQRLETSFGITSGGTWAVGDFNYDGKVDFSDYQLLETSFGRVVNPALVPEPLTALLLVAGAVSLLRRR